jgi:cytochrome c553
MTKTKLSLPVLLGAAALTMLAASWLTSSHGVRAQESTTLPRAVRPGIRAAMSRHAEQASALTVSVALGSYDQTAEHVDSLLAEPRLAPPSSDPSSTLNQLLPTQLFELDDRFRASLGRLRKAAQAHDDEQSIAQLGAVVRACRACHRALGSASPVPERTFPKPKGQP